MNSKELLKTSFGELNVEVDVRNFTETRSIKFEKSTLIISWLDIDAIYYTLELQANLPPGQCKKF